MADVLSALALVLGGIGLGVVVIALREAVMHWGSDA